MKKPLKIEFKPYNKNYPSYFQKEKEIIRNLGKSEMSEFHKDGRNSEHAQKPLRQVVFDIYHIGSTSVPGMPGKPEIDILILLKTEKQRKNLVEKLVNIGYNKTRIKHKNRLFLFKEKNKYIFNLHLMLASCKTSRQRIKFRDYLINNPYEFKRYLELKKKNFKKSKAYHVVYRELKEDYFKNILRKI